MEEQGDWVVTETGLGPRVNGPWRRASRLLAWIRDRGIGATLYAQPRTRKAALLLRTNLSADRVRELLLRAPN